MTPNQITSAGRLPVQCVYLVPTAALFTPPRVDCTIAEVICRLGPGWILNCQLLVVSTTAVPSFTIGDPGVVL